MDSLSAHRDFGSAALNEADIDVNPFVQFGRWLADAEAAGLSEPNGMVLSTVGADGTPSSRTVLLRGVRAGGFEFFTNYDSRKGRELTGHPVASALFPWYSLQRQVVITGAVVRVSAAESDTYFAGRPHRSQIAAMASHQSQPIDSREQLEARVAELSQRYPETAHVLRPQNWGGFRLIPARIEFWKGRRSRLHDRLVYTRVDGAVDPAEVAGVTGSDPTRDGATVEGGGATGAPVPRWHVTRLQP